MLYYSNIKTNLLCKHTSYNESTKQCMKVMHLVVMLIG